MDYRLDATDRITQLEDWLIAGWEIEEPVLQRSAYYRADGRVCAFEVVLCRRGERRAIALHDVPAVQTFLVQRRLAVLDLS